jgi:hypothetical protein
MHAKNSDHRLAPRSSARRFLSVALSLALAACAPGVTIESSPAPTAAPDSTRTAGTVSVVAVPAWPVRVREHVDLWLHGFGLLQGDSSLVPYFRRGYRDELTARRARESLTTELDANAAALRNRLALNAGLVSAQFLPLYFESWEELRRGIDLFFRVQGDPRATGDATAREIVAVLATYFPSEADREWLRLFIPSLEDERAKFYGRYWLEEQRARGAALDKAMMTWRTTFAPRFERFLSNSRQRQGQILISLPLAGEGRTLTRPGHEITVTVGFPDDSATIAYVFAHEIIGGVVNDVVADNTSPAERRSGAADRYTSLGAVRGGALLLSRIAPELVRGYMRYYSSLAGPPSAEDEERTFVTRFPIPDAIRDALLRQIDNILGGI